MIDSSIRDLVIRTDTKNAIHIECKNSVSDDILKALEENHSSVGLVFREDSLYEKLNVKEYLSLFASITKKQEKMEEAIQSMHLSDCLHTAISKLNYGQKRRIAIAREIIKDHDLIYIQEPLLNLDEDSVHYILRWLEEYLPDGKQIITSSVSLKLLFLMAGNHYYADEYGVQALTGTGSEDSIPEINIEDLIDSKIKQAYSEAAQNETAGDTAPKDEKVNRVKLIDKISAQYEDKILLFNPNDIDYMESLNSKVHVNVRGNAFPTSYTMDELEKELERYGFFRCHRSYLVNMQKVQEIIKWTRNSYSLRLEGLEDSSIPLSKGRIEELRKKYKF